MKNLTFYIIFSSLIILSQQFECRLSNISEPIKYNLEFNLGHLNFMGKAQIILRILEKTQNLTLHSFNLRIRKNKTVLFGQNHETLKPERHIIKRECKFLILKFSQYLHPGRYLLMLNYVGVINTENRGIFYDNYENETKK